MTDFERFHKMPIRQAKKRSFGLTSVIDVGFGCNIISDQLRCCSPHVDIVKLAFGTALLTAGLEEKISVYRSFDVDVCLGGTLFEFFYQQRRLNQYRELLEELGLSTVEISDGSISIPVEEKLSLIADFARKFRVLSEVGQKDPGAVVAPAKWVRSIFDELNAGSSFVILEGRESGSAGLYRESGEIRRGLIEEVLDSGVASNRLIFEAPRKNHQAYLIKILGPNVNLANIALFDVLSCESLRQGLRFDTFDGLRADLS